VSASSYVPQPVWTWEKADGGLFAAMNRPLAGPTHEHALPVGRHPFQLYSLATPNGQKAAILFEELLAAGHAAEYDAWPIHILRGEQFSSGFVAVNPNGKVPALVDRTGAEPVRLFESGAILLHLAEKFGAFLPADAQGRAECLSWLFWQVASIPLLSGMFGHFYHYAPAKLRYAIDRYAMETKRLFDVADRRLGESRYLAGGAYTIADIALFPWARDLQRGVFYGDAATFLALGDYRHVGRWVDEIDERPAVRRGRAVNGVDGSPPPFLAERHQASDFAAIGL